MPKLDVPRGDVQLLTAVAGGSAPLPVAFGRIDAVEGLTETLCRLSCQGRDAFLEPLIVPGVVTYLPGDDPLLTTAPVPEDPCGADAEPTVTPGIAPAEPDPLPEPPPGPEPSEPTDPVPVDGEDTLLGAWLVFMDYTLTEGAGPSGETVYVGSTTATQFPLPFSGLTDPRDNWPIQRIHRVGIGSEAFPETFTEFFIYRGPDITGTDLIECQQPGCVGKVLCVSSYVPFTAQTLPESGLTVKLAHYTGAGIASQADLEALRPQNPLEATDPFPARVETLHTESLNLTEIPPSTGRVGDEVIVSGGSIGLSLDAGPQILRLELESGWSSGIGADNIRFARLTTGLGPANPGSSLNVALEAP